CQQHNKYPYTF
nr:immunoglobulin light chain junction region [Macaca mulatta]